MTEYGFLAYISDPFGAVEPRLVLSDYAGTVKEVSLREITSCADKLVTYDVARLIELLKVGGQRLPQCVIDASDVLRILSGVSRDDGGEPHWDVIRAMARYFVETGDADAFD
jgi:hypothetical protein